MAKKPIPKLKKHTDRLTTTRGALAKRTVEVPDFENQDSVFEGLLSAIQCKHFENPDAKDRALYSALESGILDLLPVAERTYRAVRTDRAMAPLDKLVLQLRDVLNESKKLRELETQHVKIIVMVEGCFRSLLESFVDEAHVFKTGLKSDLSRQDFAKVDKAMLRLVDSQRSMVRELLATLTREIEGYFKAPPAATRTTRRK